MSTKCVLLSGFGESELSLKETLRTSLSPYDLDLVHASDLPAGTSIAKRISDALTAADLVIADVSTMNPNILFDIGYASGRGVPVILLAEREAGIPASLESSRIILFEKGQKPSSDAFESLRSMLETLGVPHKKPLSIRPPTGMISPRFLENPFGLLTAESVPSGSITELFVSPPYFPSLTSLDTVVIEGQRGTGKTTLLQMMRARNVLKMEGAAVAGFYINFNEAAHFLGAELSVLSDPSQLVAYVNLLFLRSAVDELAHVRDLGHISADEEISLVSILPNPAGSPVQVTSLGQLSTMLTHVLDSLRGAERTHLFYNLTPSTDGRNTAFMTVSFLGMFAAELRKRVQLFSDRRPAFLLDDYATDWLRNDLIEALNEIIFQPSQDCCFKVATIPGRQNFSLGPRRYVSAEHDFRLVSTDSEAWGDDLAAVVQFATSIIERRLQIAGSPLSAETLFDTGQAAEKGTHYSGLKRLALLCGDDYRSLIELCDRMIREAHGFDEPVPQPLQDRVVIELSHQRVKSLEELPTARDSYEFLIAIMAFLRDVSSPTDSAPSKRRRSRPILRTEIAIQNPLQLSSDDNQKLLTHVRSGILYPVLSGRPRIEEQRFGLKKLFFPAFGVPLALPRHHLVFSPTEASRMLHEPRAFWRQRRRKHEPS